MHEPLLVAFFTYGSEIVTWREKEWSRIWGVQIDNLISLIGIRRRDKVSNALINQLCGVTKGVDEKIDEGVLRW